MLSSDLFARSSFRVSCCCIHTDKLTDPYRMRRRTTLIPYEEYTPRNLWSKVAAPDPRFWAATGVYNVPMNLTWVNGTMFTVRSDHHTAWDLDHSAQQQKPGRACGGDARPSRNTHARDSGICCRACSV